MDLLLRTAERVLFVDGYYDPFNSRYQSTVRECLVKIHGANPGAICEIHHLDHQRCPSTDAIEREAAQKFSGIIPSGMTINISLARRSWRRRLSRTLLADRQRWHRYRCRFFGGRRPPNHRYASDELRACTAKAQSLRERCQSIRTCRPCPPDWRGRVC